MATVTLGRSKSRSILPRIGTGGVNPLLPARPDHDIAADVRRALDQDVILRAVSNLIDVNVSAAVVRLSGYVVNGSHKVRAETDVRRVPGVQRIENDLISDPDLEVAVAGSLAQDTRLCSRTILVHSNAGVIRLDGQVDRDALAEAAECCAARVPAVRAVVNCIQTTGAGNRQPERVLLPGIGQDVYLSDRWLGRVERVVLSRKNRCVSAIAVEGHIYAPGLATERLILIPINAVRHVNASGVELAVTIDDVAGYPEFNAARFVAPERGWRPPLDYHRDAVLLEPTEGLLPD